MELGWRLLPLSLKWRAGYLLFAFNKVSMIIAEV